MRCVRALLHDRAGLACLLFLGIVLLAALLAPWLTPWDPLAVDGSRKLAPCGPEHGLGTGPRSRWGPGWACWRALCAGGWSPASCGCAT